VQAGVECGEVIRGLMRVEKHWRSQWHPSAAGWCVEKHWRSQWHPSTRRGEWDPRGSREGGADLVDVFFALLGWVAGFFVFQDDVAAVAD
jgi:hypothetical protein